jgi:dolichol kinase
MYIDFGFFFSFLMQLGGERIGEEWSSSFFFWLDQKGKANQRKIYNIIHCGMCVSIVRSLQQFRHAFTYLIIFSLLPADGLAAVGGKTNAVHFWMTNKFPSATYWDVE